MVAEVTMTPSTLLVGTMHALLALDPMSGVVRRLHEGAGSYYGIAYDANGFWVACRCEVKKGELPFIGRFHWDGTLHAKIRPPTFALNDMHQIQLADGKLWVVCSGSERIARYDIETQTWDVWALNGVEDHHHINSLWIDDEQVFVLAHNQPPGQVNRTRPSEVWKFAKDGQRALDYLYWPAGFSAHNVWLERGYPWVLDSAGGRLSNANSRHVMLYGWPRGIAWPVGGHAYIGISAHVYDKMKRAHSESEIAAFDPDWQLTQTFPLDGCGPIWEVRTPFQKDRTTTMAPVPVPVEVPPSPPSEAP